MRFNKSIFNYKETIALLLLFLISIVVSYLLPAVFTPLWYWGLIVVFFFSKTHLNHIFIVFFWLLFSSPGYLFSDSGLYHLPVIEVKLTDREILYQEIFAIIIILKAFLYPLRQEVFYKKYIYVIIGFSIFLLFFGTFISTSILTALKSLRYFIPILILPALPRLIPYALVPNTIKLLFVTVFILISAQLFDLLIGIPFAAIIGESQLMFSGSIVKPYSKVFDVNQGVVRTIYGPFILLISLVTALAYLVVDRSIFKRNFLILITIITTISIFISATRGWIIGIIVLLLGFAIKETKRFSKIIFTAIFIITIIILALPKINLQINQTIDRVLTLKEIASGDITAGGTLTRLTDRGPRVMSKFYESPILGFGFSADYYEYSDGHVGNQNLLLNSGIIGFIIYYLFLLFLLRRYYMEFRKRRNLAAFVFLFGLISIIIIHSSSAMIFGYSLQVVPALSLGIFFFFSDYFLRNL